MDAGKWIYENTFKERQGDILYFGVIMTTNPKGKQREYNHRYYRKHKKEHRKVVHEYYLKNKKKIAKTHRKYYLSHKEDYRKRYAKSKRKNGFWEKIMP